MKKLKYALIGSVALASFIGCKSEPQVIRNMSEAYGFDVTVQDNGSSKEVRIGNYQNGNFVDGEGLVYAEDWNSDSKADLIESYSTKESNLENIANTQRINLILRTLENRTK